MKRFFIALILVAICMVFLPNDAHAATVASGKCGANLSWTLDSTGTMTIFGTGDMYVYTYQNFDWAQYRSSVKQIVIKDGVTNIGNYAFDYFDSLSNVSMASSVTSIGAYAFRGCSKLTSITIHHGVKTIGKRAFEQSGLTSVVIPDSVTVLEEAAFIYCSKLTRATIGNGITAIPTDAFYYCTSMKSVNIPYGVTSIGESAFSWCALTSVSIPESVTMLGKYAFNSNNNLTSITIPASVEQIDEFAFANCKLLSAIHVSDYNKNYSSDDAGVLFDKNKETLICVPAGKYGTYNVPDGVVTISENAVYGCSNLTGVTIPDSVQHVGDYAFYDCKKLACTTYDNAKYIGNSNNPYMVLLAATSTGITSCMVHPQTRFIESYAFSSCTALKDIFMQDSIIGIASYAFSRCSAIKNITYCGTEAQWNEIVLGDNSELLKATRTYHGEATAEANCTTPSVCSVCGDVMVAPLGHTGQWVELVPVTCTEEGVKARVCEVCGETEVEYIPSTGHVVHGKVVQPTCTQQGTTTYYCNYCDYSEVIHVTPPTGHSYEETITVAATCTQEGRLVKNCTTCGDTVTEVIPAKGHSWSSWINTVQSTCTKEGTRIRFCTCGVRETETIAKLPHSYADGVCTTCNTAMSGYAVLNEDMDLTGLSLNEDLYIDLNGYDLSGTIITNGYAVYGMDSTTDSYSYEAIGYFNCVDENGDAIIPVTHFKSDITGSVKRYMAIQNENGYSFHRFYLGITHQTLRPGVDGVGYKAVFYGDSMVAANLDSFGYTMTLGNYTPKTITAAASSFVSGKTVSLVIKNYDVETYGETDLSASVMLKLKDGTVIESAQRTMTLRSLLEILNTNYTTLNTDQLNAVADFIKKYAIVKTWKVENLI